jgi:hypothetical protein
MCKLLSRCALSCFAVFCLAFASAALFPQSALAGQNIIIDGTVNGVVYSNSPNGGKP